MACYRIVESCDASAVSLVKSGPAREPHHLYAVHDWTRQGTEGFLGHRRCQGQTSGARARRQGALILMGGWCGAQGADITTRKTGVRLRLQIWGGLAEHNKQRAVKSCGRERYCLLTGAF
jgi:hypothetical protein